MVNGATGEPLTSFTFNYFYRLRRSALRTLLSTNLDICHGKKLVSITYPTDGTAVIAHFADTSTATGTLLVGADSARSTMRSLLLGPKLSTIDTVPFGSTCTRSQALFLCSFHPLYLDAAHPAGQFAFFGVQHAPETRVFFYVSWRYGADNAACEWTKARRFTLAKGHGAARWRGCATGIQSGAQWDPGARVTMVGDAVHPMTYQRAQALNHSVTDAGRLAAAIEAMEGGGAEAV